MFKTVTAALLALFSGSKVRGEVVEIYPLDEASVRLSELELLIDGATVGTLRYRAGDDEKPLQVRVGSGFKRYQVRGWAELEGGAKLAVEGAGVLFSKQAFLDELAQRSAPIGTIVAVFAEWRQLAGEDALPRLEVLESGGPEAIAAAEARLGVRFPDAYRETLAVFGAMQVIASGEDGPETIVAWYPPAAVVSVPTWRREVRDAPLGEGDSAAARANVAKLERDLVLGSTFDTVWTLRGGTHAACPGGAASLSGEYLFEVDPAEELWLTGTDAYQSYFGDTEPRCGTKAAVIRDNIAAAIAEAFARSTTSPHNSALRFTARSELRSGEALRVSLGE